MATYTGYDRTARAKRAGMEMLVDLIEAYFGLWNNGTLVVRNMRGKSKPSVHSTGRAADVSWRGGNYRGTGNYADCEKLCDFLTENAEELGIELLLDYWPRPHGRGWRCDRNAWRTYTSHAMSGSPGGDWLHFEISNEHADDAQHYVDVFQRLLGDPPKAIKTPPARKTARKPAGKDPWLQVGSKGDQVKEIQAVVGVEADGAFGPLTEAAVKKWQAEHDLFVDGIVGPDTYKAMTDPSTAVVADDGPSAADKVEDRTEAAPTPAPAPAPEYPGRPIRNGWRGDVVKAIQAKVGAQPVDGFFGPRTHGVIVNWQGANGLRQDGVVGPLTWAKMFG